VIAVQRPRRPEQCHISSGDITVFKGNEVSGGLGQLAAPAKRDNDHAHDYRGGDDYQHHWHKGNRAMLRAMAGALDRLPAGGTSLLAMAGSLAEAAAAVRAGAALVELGTADPAAIAAFRDNHRGIGICAAAEQADITRDPALARRGGGILACAGPAAADSAGLPASRLLVGTEPARLAAVRAAGYATLVDLQDESGADAGVLAVAAISAWLGATVVRTWHPRQVRRALDMTESIRGIRPPARTVRGLG
jgi:hypothetical protein